MRTRYDWSAAAHDPASPRLGPEDGGRSRAYQQAVPLDAGTRRARLQPARSARRPPEAIGCSLADLAGQRTRFNWTRMNRLATRWLPPARVRHPFPNVRFDATTRRQEPSALAAHAGICAGGRPQGRSLPRTPRPGGEGVAGSHPVVPTGETAGHAAWVSDKGPGSRSDVATGVATCVRFEGTARSPRRVARSLRDTSTGAG